MSKLRGKSFETIILDDPIDWKEVLENVGKRGAETFGRPDMITEDVYRAWKAARTPLSADPQLEEFRKAWAKQQVINSELEWRLPIWNTPKRIK